MISLKNVKIIRGGATILSGVSLDVPDGSIVTVIGESGSGKSTLLRAVMRLLPIAAGDITIDGVRINDLSEPRMDEVRKKMGMVFQEGALFDSMTVGENVAFALRRHTRMKRPEIARIVTERLEAVGLEGTEKMMPDQLSGGMRRRVAVARALALSPGILLYDEPTTGLDPILSRTILDLIVKMRERYKTTSIVVTHDMDAAVTISDRIAMVRDHTITEEGDVQYMLENPNPDVRRFFRKSIDREVKK